MLIEECLCGSQLYTTFVPVVVDNRALDMRIASCANCATKWLMTEEAATDVADYYRSGAYHNDRERHAGVVDYRERFYQDTVAAAARFVRYERVLGPDRWPRGGDEHFNTWLDVGAAKGALIVEARQRGFKAIGLEVDPVFAGDLVQPGTIETVEPGWDFISYLDVLEHLPDPLKEIALATVKLRRGGVMIVEVPDVHVCAGDKHFKREHLWYFTLRTLIDVVCSSGLELLAIDFPIPGKMTVYAWLRP